jgi:hypothetical protein
VHWVRPQVVVEVSYLTWTEDNPLRQVSYQGQGEDKPAMQVVRPVLIRLGIFAKRITEAPPGVGARAAPALLRS